MSFVFDPEDPAVHDDLYGTYRRLRDEHPVYAHPSGRLWALSRYEDVDSALTQPELLASSGVEEDRMLLPMMIYMEPAAHDPMRALVSRAFTPRRIEKLEDQVRAVARDLFDAWHGSDGGDLMRDVALELPNRVIAELIGIPEDRRRGFLAHTESLITAAGKPGTLERAAAGIYAEFSRLLASRREVPRDDLMSALVQVELDGEKLSDEQLLGFCFLLIVGGSDTTTNLIGNGAVLLDAHPDQRSWLCEDLSRLPDAIEEMLRYEAPTQSQPRRPDRDIELHGVTIPANVRLLLLLGSANHDERVFEDPERFDVTRQPGRHLSFGMGVHFCMGSALARQEARIAFEELLTRYPDYAVGGETTWAASRWARHHPSIPVRI